MRVLDRQSPMNSWLQVCADTMVGDDMLRGISGGQKKRVTASEMIVGPKKVLFLDEISTGLVCILATFDIEQSQIGKVPW